MSVRVCVCNYACECPAVCTMPMSVEARTGHEVPSSTTPDLIVLRVGHSLTRSRFWLAWLSSGLLESSVFALITEAHTASHARQAFYVGAGDSNPGPRVCRPEPPPQPPTPFLLPLF